VPLAFISAGLVAAAVGTGWLVSAPGLLLLPHVHPQVVAFAHAWLLGALLTICCGAVYQLLPVLANTGFKGAPLAWLHLALHGAGVTLMVAGFHSAAMGLVAAGGTLVTAGFGLFAANVAGVLRRAPRVDPILLSFALAAGWLVLTALAGLLLALDLRFGWWPVDLLALLRAHAHLGVIGFFITLLQGATFRLIPMFTLSAAPDLTAVRRSLLLSQGGLLVLVPSLAWGVTMGEAAGALALAASFILSGRELRRLLATRRKRWLEPGLNGFLAGCLLLGVAALGGTALVFGGADFRVALAYGLVAVFGGLLACIEGMLCKIVPFLVWMRTYGPRVGRQPTPQATALGHAGCERGWLRCHLAGVTLLAIGTAGGFATALLAGAVLFAAGQGLLFVSLGAAARHVWFPVTFAPSPALSPASRLA
jgi:hypothetical protein